MNLSAALKWISFARVILPLALGAAGVPADRIDHVVNAVGAAETALGAGTGAEKLKAVVTGVADSMAASGADPHTIAATTAAVASGLQTGIAVVNAVQQVHQDQPPLM